MSDAAAPIGLFVVVLAALWLGFPVAFTLAGTAVLFALGASAFGLFDLALLAAAPSRILGALTTPELAAVPLFILMGALMARSGVAEALLTAFAARLGGRPGGLGQATIGVGAALSACTGVVAASVTALATLAGPTMRRAGYDDRLIAGTVCAAGALGQITPPSILLIFLSVEIQSAHAAAQRSLGVFAPTPVTAADLFVAALAPSALLVIAFIGVVWVWSRRRPHNAPPTPATRRPSLIGAGLAPMALIFAALGSIILGLATPSEAAGLGAAGAALLAARRG
ncbi:MAG: TRAP transporter large permease subunit, partial [Pseudomonadota bacterium]